MKDNCPKCLRKSIFFFVIKKDFSYEVFEVISTSRYCIKYLFSNIWICHLCFRNMNLNFCCYSEQNSYQNNSSISSPTH